MKSIRPNTLSQSYKNRAFSLTELLAVIVIIVFMVSMSFSFVRSMKRSSNLTSTEAALNGAVSAARLIAGTPRSELEPLSNLRFQKYVGAAVLVTNTDQIRLIEHDTSWLEDPEITGVGGTNPDYYYGYRDIVNRDFVEIPDGVRIVGFFRNGATSPGYNGLQMITPPFAIRFNENGEFSHGTPGNTAYNIYYDHDYDGDLTNPIYPYASVNTNRLEDYDAYDMDPSNADGITAQVWRDDITISTPSGPIEEGKFELPFELIETVAGIAIFHEDAIEQPSISADPSWDFSLVPDPGDRYLNEDTVKAILKDATVVFFDANTGGPIKLSTK